MNPMKNMVLTLGVAVAMVACDEAPAPADPSSEVAEAETHTPSREEAGGASLGAEGRAQIVRALAAYETVRAALVADSADISTAATQIAEAADAATERSPVALRAHLTGMATEARELAAAPASDIARVRREFGDVSRHVVELLGAEASLAEGKHVFHCPMAEDYGQWVQNDADIQNPYMGSRMPACGAETSFDAT